MKGKSRRAYGQVTKSYGIKSCVNSSKPIHIYVVIKHASFTSFGGEKKNAIGLILPKIQI